MSKIKFIVPVLAVLLFVSAAPVHAEGLTSVQIQAILSLLNSFGADQATINSVNASLGGTGTVPAATAAPATTVTTPASSTGSTASTPSTTATSPSASASCLTLTHSLALNQGDAMTGGEVSKLQKFLGGQVNGHFGPATTELVKNWQKAHGISTTGTTGPSTRASMACK